jgi:hypothetical protein
VMVDGYRNEDYIENYITYDRANAYGRTLHLRDGWSIEDYTENYMT